MWPEVEKAKVENRHELVLSGKEVSKRISETGLDPIIFQLTSLNYLDISQTALEKIPDEIENLSNLQTLVLHSNKIEIMNEKICKLPKLKILDLSNNIIRSVPNDWSNLLQLNTINLSGNCIEDFPSSVKKCCKLAVVNLSNNKLIKFPDICSEDLANLAELKIRGNNIEVIPNNIYYLSGLKSLDIGANKIKSVPGELSDCQKLKEIDLKGNPLSDRRLLKLIEQCKTKQILDYIKQNCPRIATKEGNKSTKGKTKKKELNSDEETDDETKAEYKYKITVKPASENFKIMIMNSVKNVREHFLACIVNNVTFTEESFKKFIQLQNKLHDTVCEKRNVATIATHDFNKLALGDLVYTTAAPNELIIKPLNKMSEITGLELFSKLQTEANNLRKEKKRNTYSGIHRYLYLIEGKSQYPCLKNSKDEVISLPPITNSDISKIEVNSTKIFIEVTSSTSLFVCRTVMDTILREMVLLFEHNIEVTQVKTTDQDSNLKNTYPSKNDLKFDKNVPITVERDF